MIYDSKGQSTMKQLHVALMKGIFLFLGEGYLIVCNKTLTR